MFTWLGKSERPVPTINAPPSFASSGNISGVGFAIANTIDFSAIVATISFVNIFGAETPINTSFPFTMSANFPSWSFLLVTANISF